MKAIVKDIIYNLMKKFPVTCIKYEYKKLSNTHFVEIQPLSLLNNNEFLIFGVEAGKTLYNTKDVDYICFIKEGDLIKIDYPEYSCMPIPEIKAKQEKLATVDLEFKWEFVNIWFESSSLSLAA